jgi:ubiquinone/menaquinone biosynthesis C-methylase UbiE
LNLQKFFRLLLAIPLALVFIWLVPMKLIARIATRLGHASPCPAALAGLVDNPLRQRYMRAVPDRIGIQSGECVLELGPGPGFFTVEAARRAGPEGRLIAVDIQPKMIALLEQRLQQAGVSNVETHVASAYELPVADASLDRAFLVTVLPEIPDPRRALAELHRTLKPGGVLSITEEFLDPDYPLAAETIPQVEAAGFRLAERHGNFWLYTLNFVK